MKEEKRLMREGLTASLYTFQATILVIIFWHFLIISLRSESPKVKRYLISRITNLFHLSRYPLVDFCRQKRHFSRQKYLIMENIKKTPQIKSEAVVQRCSVNKVFLEISPNSQENTCAGVSFTLLKKRLWHRCFPVNFVKFTRAPFFIEQLWWLLL